MWYIYAILTAGFETAKDVVSKKYSHDADTYISAFVFQLFAAISLLPFVLYSGIPHFGNGYYWGLLAVAIILPSWSLLYMYAIRSSPLSVTIPMLAFNPLLTAIFSIWFDHRFPSFIGWSGITLICVGLYFLRLDKATLHKGFLYPIIRLKDEKGALAMLGVAVLWSIGSHFNKIIIQNSSPIFTAFTITGFGSIVLLGIAFIRTRVTMALLVDHAKRFWSVGIFHGMSELSLMEGLFLGYTPYVVSVKRLSMLFSSIMGKIIFKESISRSKAFGICLMFIGVVLLINFQ
jgi:uncharacterized membrane protein